MKGRDVAPMPGVPPSANQSVRLQPEEVQRRASMRPTYCDRLSVPMSMVLAGAAASSYCRWTIGACWSRCCRKGGRPVRSSSWPCCKKNRRRGNRLLYRVARCVQHARGCIHNNLCYASWQNAGSSSRISPPRLASADLTTHPHPFSQVLLAPAYYQHVRVRNTS